MGWLLHSLNGRLLLASVLLLPLFLGLTGYALHTSYARSVEAAEAERLELQLYTLLADAEYEQSLWLPQRLADGRFNQPGSGLYGAVWGADNTLLWRSPSALTLASLALPAQFATLVPGQGHFGRWRNLYYYHFPVSWLSSNGQESLLQFVVFHDQAIVQAELAQHRRGLWLWLGGACLLLVVLQGVILRWGLRPLQAMAADIKTLEQGETLQLGGDYPVEIRPVTDNLNRLLSSEQKRRERVRNTLADLAHSLKTPLAIVSSADTQAPGYAALVAEQAEAMQVTVDYYLQRSVNQRFQLLQKLPVKQPLQKLVRAMGKVYGERELSIELAADEAAVFCGDERDFLEIAGILLDNACKYCDHRVHINAQVLQDQLQLVIEDDGRGIPKAMRQAILQRGTRADSASEGQGLGLAVLLDILHGYDGKLDISASAMGGARFVITV